MEHFKKEKREISIFLIILLSFVHILTLGATWFFMYEMWAEPHYWKNRWKLHRLLKEGKVKVKLARENSIFGDQIKYYDLVIDEIEYAVTIWNGEHMTLDYADLKNTNFIGLFIGSLTTKWLNRIAVKKIIQLSEHNLHETKPSQELTHINFGNEKVHLDSNVIR